MTMSLLLAALLQVAPAATPQPGDPVETDWRDIPADELMVMTLGGGRRVVVRLAPAYAPRHVTNVRTLVLKRWWDEASVYRVQENWVAQWGDATEKKPLPAGISDRPAAEFEIPAFAPAVRMAKADPYSTASGITADGWPVATDGTAAWLTHCYGMVGVARDALPSTGSGAELFTPIGQSARRLDRNYTVVGRIVEGMQYLSALPRSDAPLGGSMRRRASGRRSSPRGWRANCPRPSGRASSIVLPTIPVLPQWCAGARTPSRRWYRWAGRRYATCRSRCDRGRLGERGCRRTWRGRPVGPVPAGGDGTRVTPTPGRDKAGGRTAERIGRDAPAPRRRAFGLHDSREVRRGEPRDDDDPLARGTMDADAKPG